MLPTCYQLVPHVPRQVFKLAGEVDAMARRTCGNPNRNLKVSTMVSNTAPSVRTCAKLPVATDIIHGFARPRQMQHALHGAALRGIPQPYQFPQTGAATLDEVISLVDEGRPPGLQGSAGLRRAPPGAPSPTLRTGLSAPLTSTFWEAALSCVAMSFADGHTASNAPDLFRPPKLSGAGPG